MKVILIIIAYLILMNIAGFASMAIDKWKAVHRSWRIPEVNLILIAIIGGSVGSILGMKFCRHRTKHWYFVFGMPAILVIQVLILAYIIFSGKFGILW